MYVRKCLFMLQIVFSVVFEFESFFPFKMVLAFGIGIILSHRKKSGTRYNWWKNKSRKKLSLQYYKDIFEYEFKYLSLGKRDFRSLWLFFFCFGSVCLFQFIHFNIHTEISCIFIITAGVMVEVTTAIQPDFQFIW